MQAGAAALIARAEKLCADLTTVCAQSRALLNRSRVLLLSPPPISGGSSGDFGLIATLTDCAPLCLDCIVRRTGIPALQVERALMMIPRAVRLAIAIRACAACRTMDVTFSVTTGTNLRTNR